MQFTNGTFNTTKGLRSLKTQWFIELITLFTSPILFKFRVPGRKCTGWTQQLSTDTNIVRPQNYIITLHDIFK